MSDTLECKVVQHNEHIEKKYTLPGQPELPDLIVTYKCTKKFPSQEIYERVEVETYDIRVFHIQQPLIEYVKTVTPGGGTTFRIFRNPFPLSSHLKERFSHLPSEVHHIISAVDEAVHQPNNTEFHLTAFLDSNGLYSFSDSL